MKEGREVSRHPFASQRCDEISLTVLTSTFGFASQIHESSNHYPVTQKDQP